MKTIGSKRHQTDSSIPIERLLDAADRGSRPQRVEAVIGRQLCTIAPRTMFLEFCFAWLLNAREVSEFGFVRNQITKLKWQTSGAEQIRMIADLKVKVRPVVIARIADLRNFLSL